MGRTIRDARLSATLLLVYAVGMTMSELELADVLNRIRKEHDVAPFLQQLHSTAEMSFKPMPAEMLAIVAGSGDYSEPQPGSAPVWLQIAAGNESAELVVYCAAADHALYALAPL